MNVLDLFSGIGGFSLGLERAGMRTVAFCEIEPYCRAVLRKHWPDVPIFEDVRKLTAADVPGVDVICGGFPCQDISVAGKGAGITGERSGLWKEYARLIGEIRPRYAIVENVAALLKRGLSTVVGDLAEIGYDAEWHIISAADVGAPHRRERVWIVAYPMQDGWNGRRGSEASFLSEIRQTESNQQSRSERVDWACALGEYLADSDGERMAVRGFVDATSAASGLRFDSRSRSRSNGDGQSATGKDADMAYPSGAERHGRSGGAWWWCREPAEALQDARLRGRQEDDVWHPECELGRVADGIPDNVERLGALGNSVVPQIPEIIGRAIMQAEGLK